MFKRICLFSTFIIYYSCGQSPVPKPAAQLRLDYDEAVYQFFDSDCPFDFDVNSDATIILKEACNMIINYPRMKASVFITYKRVDKNLELLLRDAQKLTYEHVIKADDIVEQLFIDSAERVYGMLYRVGGNAATNSQFYVTDSVKHFVTGSLYFSAKPNYDSILPATNYLNNDIKVLMESFRWK